MNFCRKLEILAFFGAQLPPTSVPIDALYRLSANESRLPLRQIHAGPIGVDRISSDVAKL